MTSDDDISEDDGMALISDEEAGISDDDAIIELSCDETVESSEESADDRLESAEDSDG